VRPLDEWLAERESAVGDFPYPIQDSVIHHLFADGWLWHIPFENGVTSLGYVFADANAARCGLSPEATWSATLRDRPALQELFGDARLTSIPGRVFQTGRLQRLRAAGAGVDWAALPYTVGFIDALHSTGIAQTLYGVTRLGHILLTLTGGEQAAALNAYSHDVVREVRQIDLFVAGCYAALCDFRLFAAWSMVYFAAATTFERRWRRHSDDRPGLLCVDDAEFTHRVGALYGGLCSLNAADARLSAGRVSAFCNQVRNALRPYNTVGLFEPAVPNMYFHTSATK
jgi:FADH2 O2-dependent halogenase